MSDPVSWFLIERGWKVVGKNGNELGTIDELIGDSGQDIFDGLSVSSHLFTSARYLPAERVTRIEEGTVYVDLDDLSDLEAYKEPPPSEQILPTKASWWDRLRAKF